MLTNAAATTAATRKWTMQATHVGGGREGQPQPLQLANAPLGNDAMREEAPDQANQNITKLQW